MSVEEMIEKIVEEYYCQPEDCGEVCSICRRALRSRLDKLVELVRAENE